MLRAKLMIGFNSATQICPDGLIWRGAWGGGMTARSRRKQEGEGAPVPGSVLSRPEVLAFSNPHLTLLLPCLKPSGGHPGDTQVTWCLSPQGQWSNSHM